LNKIDRLYEWKSNRHKDVEDVVKSQSQNTQIEFQKRAQEGKCSNIINSEEPEYRSHCLIKADNIKIIQEFLSEKQMAVTNVEV
jgi:hypothetical protein